MPYLYLHDHVRPVPRGREAEEGGVRVVGDCHGARQAVIGYFRDQSATKRLPKARGSRCVKGQTLEKCMSSEEMNTHGLLISCCC